MGLVNVISDEELKKIDCLTLYLHEKSAMGMLTYFCARPCNEIKHSIDVTISKCLWVKLVLPEVEQLRFKDISIVETASIRPDKVHFRIQIGKDFK